MNNFEKIKGMSIEEMAEFINELTSCDCGCCMQELNNYCNNDCLNERRRYLKSEATDE